ncbi:MAG: riboflavin biosynthesis protein RibF [bacterium]
MEIINDIPDCSSHRSAAIGTFDGLHRGHREIIDRTVKWAEERGVNSSVVTFEPPPELVLTDQEAVDRRLLTREEKMRTIKDLQVDIVYEITFDREFASTSPEEFTDRILSDRLNARAIYVGSNFRFGHQRSGNVSTLKQRLEPEGVEVHPVEAIEYNGEPVSSTRIRECIRSGEISRANELLGRQYFVHERRIRGEGRGREIGFPTLNFTLERTIRPKHGVYCVWVGSSQSLPGVANIGTRPTVDDSEQVVLEVHMLDEVPEIPPGTRERIFLGPFIRNERSFESVDELKRQIEQDVQQAEKTFDELDSPDHIRDSDAMKLC